MATHALNSSHILDDDDAPAAIAAMPAGRPLLRRFYDALIETQMRRAQRELDRVLGPGALARAIATDLPPER